MANQPDTKKPEASNTATKTATGFWSFLDEIKDDVFAWAKKFAAFGIGGLALIPLIFTGEGRAFLTELFIYVKLNYGERAAAEAYKWTMRGYLLLRGCIIWGLVLLLALGLTGIIWITTFPQWGDRVFWMFWDVLTVSMLAIYGWAKLAPLALTVGIGAGAFGSLADKELSLKTIRSLPAFLFSGGKTGVEWIDGLWRITSRIAWFYSIGAPWFALAPFHNDPPMRYLAGMMIPVLFWAHMSYKPGPERGPFWWWVNWAIAFTVMDITLWLNFPEFTKALFPTDPNQVHTWLHWLIRVSAIAVFLGQLVWIFFLARSAARGKINQPTQVGYGRSLYSMAAPNHFWYKPLQFAVVIIIVLLVFLALKYDRQWTTSMDHPVTEVVNPGINRVANAVSRKLGGPQGQLLPVGMFGDGRYPPLELPNPPRRSANGDIVDVTFPASKEQYHTKLFPNLAKVHVLVVIPPGSYTWVTPDGSEWQLQNGTYLSLMEDEIHWRIRSVAGDLEEGHLVRPMDFHNRRAIWKKDYVRVGLPEGGLFVRQGNRTPVYAGNGRLDWHVPKPGYLGWKDAPEDEAFVGLNHRQIDNKNEYLAGQITVRFIRRSA